MFPVQLCLIIAFSVNEIVSRSVENSITMPTIIDAINMNSMDSNSTVATNDNYLSTTTMDSLTTPHSFNICEKFQNPDENRIFALHDNGVTVIMKAF